MMWWIFDIFKRSFALEKLKKHEFPVVIAENFRPLCRFYDLQIIKLFKNQNIAVIIFDDLQQNNQHDDVEQ